MVGDVIDPRKYGLTDIEPKFSDISPLVTHREINEETIMELRRVVDTIKENRSVVIEATPLSEEPKLVTCQFCKEKIWGVRFLNSGAKVIQRICGFCFRVMEEESA